MTFWNLSFLLAHSPRVRLPRKGQYAGCKKPVTLSRPHLFNRRPLDSGDIFASFLGMVHPRQAGPEGYINQLGEKMEPKRWLSKKLSDKCFAQSTESYFMIMKGGQLNSKGKPHVRQNISRASYCQATRQWNRIAQGLLGSLAICSPQWFWLQWVPGGNPAALRPRVLCN